MRISTVKASKTQPQRSIASLTENLTGYWDVERFDEEDKSYDQGYQHGRGQEDGSKGVYRPPHGEFSKFLASTAAEKERIERENTAYEAGWKNAKEGKDGG